MSNVTQWTEVSKVSTLDQCGHPKIQAWKFEDGTSASMWSCVVCGRKFEPLDLQQERDAKRYQWLRRKFAIIGTDCGAVFAAMNLPLATYVAPDAAIELDAAIDTAMREGDSNG